MATGRLFPLIPNKRGEAFSNCTKRFQVVAAGRRSGKTERAKRKALLNAITGPTNGCYAFCAPTREQAKALFWDDLKAMAGDLAVVVKESELFIQLIHGPKIYVIGLDKPQRIEGRPWNGIVVDEIDDVWAYAWEQNIRPALSDRKAWCYFLGVPNGNSGLLYTLSQLHNADPNNWAFFTWPSSEILPQAEIDAAKAIMDSRLFRQEYEASFEAPAGVIYEEFNEENIKPCPYDKSKPILVGMDFNTGQKWPMSAVICQAHGGTEYNPDEIRVIAEIEQPNSHSTRLGQTLLDTYGRVEIWCDPAGNSAHSNIGTSDVAILRAMGHTVHFRYVRQQSDKHNAVRSYIKLANGKRKLFIDPSCKRVIDRLKRVSPDDLDDHLTDALSYLIWGKYPNAVRGAR